jgi:hypothetical protein
MVTDYVWARWREDYATSDRLRPLLHEWNRWSDKDYETMCVNRNYQWHWAFESLGNTKKREITRSQVKLKDL